MKLTAAFALALLAAGSLAPAAQAFEVKTIDLGSSGNAAQYTDPDDQKPLISSTTRDNLNGTKTTTHSFGNSGLSFGSSFTNRNDNAGSDPSAFPSSGFTTGRDLMPRR